MTKQLLATAAIIASLGLTACGTTSGPSAPQNTIGGSYLVGHFPGIPAVGNEPAIEADAWGPDQFRQLQYLDAQCHAQMDPYIPSIISDIAHLAVPMAITTGLGSAFGTGFGAVTAFTGVSFKQYAEYGGIAAAGSGFGSGIAAAANQRHIAKQYVQYACMHGFVARASQKATLKGVIIVPWAGAGSARRMSMPTTTVGSSDRTPVNPQDAGDAAALH